VDSLDQDLPFIEPTNPPTLDPDQEAQFTDHELQELLEQNLGILDEDEWLELC
jgi:hypothetical protein